MNILAKESRSFFSVDLAARILKRFYFLQRQIVLMQAGWIPGTGSLDLKLALAEGLWQDSLVAGQLRRRVLELRYPERRIELEDDAALLKVILQLRDAPDGTTFFHVLHETLKPFLRRLFLCYLEATDALDDGPTIRILRQALSDLDSQETISAKLTASNPEVNAAWKNAAQQLIGSLDSTSLASELEYPLPDYSPLLGGKPFSIARQAARDPRFASPAFAWPDRLDPRKGAGHGLELQIRAAVHHLNEVWATEMAAAVLFDLADQAPFEFLEDAARWCYDESRHCRMGYMRLSEFGYEPTEIPLDSFSYDAGADLDPIGRLGIIYYFETTFIHTKSERTRIFAKAGDRISSHDLDYDWADELIHTYYGNRWLKFFLERSEDARTAKEIRQVAEQAVEKIRTLATSGDYEVTRTHYERILEKGKFLAATGTVKSQ